MSATTEFVHPSKPTMFCMSITGMNDDGSLSEERIRAHLRRLVDAGIGVYLGSGGSGDGHSLEVEELGELYRIGVDECKGKIPVYCNPPEARTAGEMLRKAHQAIDAGVDLVQFYQVDMGHGSHPAVREQEAYYRELLDATDYPCALSMHPIAGYVAPPPLVIKLCADYPQVKVINYLGPDMKYLADIKEAVRDDIKFYTTITQLLPGLIMGAWGSQDTFTNQIPNICQLIVDSFVAGDWEGMQENYRILQRTGDVLGLARAESAGAAKGGCEALGFDVGPPRLPRLRVTKETVEKMRQAFDEMHLLDLENQAAAKRKAK